MAQAQTQMRKPKETGVPDPAQFMHPTLVKNKGNWKYHDRPRPGVLHHVSHSGDEIWTVRAGTQRQGELLARHLEARGEGRGEHLARDCIFVLRAVDGALVHRLLNDGPPMDEEILIDSLSRMSGTPSIARTGARRACAFSWYSGSFQASSIWTGLFSRATRPMSVPRPGRICACCS